MKPIGKHKLLNLLTLIQTKAGIDISTLKHHIVHEKAIYVESLLEF
jgi:hypothetical protein